MKYGLAMLSFVVGLLVLESTMFANPAARSVSVPSKVWDVQPCTCKAGVDIQSPGCTMPVGCAPSISVTNIVGPVCSPGNKAGTCVPADPTVRCKADVLITFSCSSNQGQGSHTIQCNGAPGTTRANSPAGGQISVSITCSACTPG